MKGSTHGGSCQAAVKRRRYANETVLPWSTPPSSLQEALLTGADRVDPSHSLEMMERAERALKEVFGLDAFRPGQSDVVAAMLAGRDVLSVAPTGSGKSISYWVPAVVNGGLTLVVSPLIALMKDQVDRLTDRGVAATF